MTGPYATGAPLYWKAGFTRPLPLAGKVLTVKGYTGHDGALVSWPDLQAWIETRGESNIGLRAAGWIGLDVDAYGAKVGAQSWANALAELGELPATVSSTARGPGQPSRIYLYRVPSAAVFDDAQRRFGEAFGPNVDVIHRSHRYIAVWPSLNPDAESAPYRWYDPAGAVMDGVPELGQLPDLPEPWLEFLAGGTVPSSERRTASPTLPGDPFTSPGHTPWTRAQMLAQVNPLLERLAAQGRTGRTALDDLMAAALVTYRFVPAFMTREKADQVLLARLHERDQADGASDPTTWKWSARHELEKAWKDRAYEAEAADDPDPDSAPDGSDPAGADPVAERERKIAERAEWIEVDREARIRVSAKERPELPDALSLANALTIEFPDLEWAVDGLMPREGICLFSAPQKAGKTTAVGNLVRALADGEKFLDAFPVPAPLKVGVIDTESGERRLYGWLGDQRVQRPDNVRVVSLRGQEAALDPRDPRCRASWLPVLEGLDVAVLDVVGPVVAALGLDENDNSQVGQFWTAWRTLLMEAGVRAGLVVHHTGHNEARAIGASAWLRYPDAIWKLEREDEDPTSARYFSAYGRDVDVYRGALEFDSLTRRLAYTTKGKGATIASRHVPTLVDLLREHGPGNQRRCVELLMDHVDGLSRDRARKVPEQGVRDRVLKMWREGKSEVYGLVAEHGFMIE